VSDKLIGSVVVATTSTATITEPVS